MFFKSSIELCLSVPKMHGKSISPSELFFGIILSTMTLVILTFCFCNLILTIRVLHCFTFDQHSSCIYLYLPTKPLLTFFLQREDKCHGGKNMINWPVFIEDIHHAAGNCTIKWVISLLYLGLLHFIACSHQCILCFNVRQTTSYK